MFRTSVTQQITLDHVTEGIQLDIRTVTLAAISSGVQHRKFLGKNFKEYLIICS